jgi:hypothetical protein
VPKVYVQCKFRPEDTRTYTYEWEGEPLKPGDIVKVADARSDGWKRVTVVSVADEAPPFACKPILGLYNPDVEPDDQATPAAASNPLDDDKILF